MKRKILAIFLTASLLVGIMAAAAAAAISAAKVAYDDDGNTVDLDSDGATQSVTYKLYSSQELTASLTKAKADNTSWTATSSSNITLSETSHSITGNSTSGSTSDSWTFTATMNSGTSGTITITETTGGSVTLDVTIGAPTKPAFTLDNDNVNLSEIWDTDNEVFYSGQTITKAKFSEDVGADEKVGFFEVTFVNEGASTKGKLTGTFSGGSGLTFKSEKIAALSDADAGKSVYHGWIEGTVPTVSSANTQVKLTVTAEDVTGASGRQTKTFLLPVNPKPTISKAEDQVFEWGKAVTFTPQGKNATSWDIIDPNTSSAKNSGHTYMTKAELQATTAGFTTSDPFALVSSDGKVSGFKGTWKAQTDQTDVLKTATVTSPTWADNWDGKDITKYVIVRAYGGIGAKAASTDKEVKFTFKGVAPTFDTTAAAVASGIGAIKYGDNIAEGDDEAVKITATGPGTISWDVTGLPEGMEWKGTPSDDKISSVLTIYGSPSETVKGKTVTITARPMNGTKAITTLAKSLTPSVTVGTDKIDIGNAASIPGVSTGDPVSTSVTGNAISTVTITAAPGPITWTVTNLPAGLTFKPNTDGTEAELSGTITAARAKFEESAYRYKIVAKNTVSNITKEISGDWMVWTKPTFKDDFIFNKKNTVKTKTKLEYEVSVANLPSKASWDVTIGGKQILSDSQPKASYTIGNSEVSVDLTKLADNKLVLTGSFDRVPAGGVAVPIKITAGNFAGDTELEHEITVQGTAPALKGESVTLVSGTKSKEFKLDKGDGPVVMTAKIDATTAKKIFGIDGEIDVSTSTANPTGIVVDLGNNTELKGGDDGKFTMTYTNSDIDSGTRRYEYQTAGYSKLPITVTAVNTDVSDKVSSAKYLVTVKANKDPYWITSNDLKGYQAKYAAGDTLPAKIELKLVQGQAVSADANWVVFRMKSDDVSGPFDITVKPTEKNGITATLNESTGIVTIAGTPTEGKKDTKATFTLEAKNPSTGASSKLAIDIVAKPKPTVDSTTLSDIKEMGKAIKITPKVTASSTGMKYVLDEISYVDENGGATTATQHEAPAATSSDMKSWLKEEYNLTFDENKGTISGKPTKPTGVNDGLKDNLLVKYHASSDVAVSDQISATIGIRGQKPKLSTKKVTIGIDGSGQNPAEIKTNVSGKADGIANITWDFPDGADDALAGLTIGQHDTDKGSAVLTGTPAKVTKKQAITVKMTNFGTEATGKLNITVNGVAPTIDGSTSVNVTAGNSETLDLKILNDTQVSEKIKWKITKKPTMKGVSAKVKGSGTTATVTVKANKKAESDTTSFTVVATDSVTKLISAAFPIDITVTALEENGDTPLEATETALKETTEGKAEETKSEIALGEGEVHMGAQRTVAKLTAQQRKFIEDQGYVIAAVLPEIEVTAAGQYDFDVDLDENVAAGAELVWFAFASKPTTDDEIVDFFDKATGEETKVVPEGHVIEVYPWLNADTKYAPVIAVKADAAEADATTVEGVKEAAEEKTEE